MGLQIEPRRAALLHLMALMLVVLAAPSGASGFVRINAALGGYVAYWVEARAGPVRRPAVWALVEVNVTLPGGKAWRAWTTTLEDGFWAMGVPAGVASVKAAYGCAQAVVSGIEVPPGRATGPRPHRPGDPEEPRHVRAQRMMRGEGGGPAPTDCPSACPTQDGLRRTKTRRPP